MAVFKKVVDELFGKGEVIDATIIPIQKFQNVKIALRKSDDRKYITFDFGFAEGTEYSLLDNGQTNNLISALHRLKEIENKFDHCSRVSSPSDNFISDFFEGLCDVFGGDILATENVFIHFSAKLTIYFKIRKGRTFYLFRFGDAGSIESLSLNPHQVDTFTHTLLDFYKRI